jgi:hypothetical protein
VTEGLGRDLARFVFSVVSRHNPCVCGLRFLQEVPGSRRLQQRWLRLLKDFSFIHHSPFALSFALCVVLSSTLTCFLNCLLLRPIEHRRLVLRPIAVAPRFHRTTTRNHIGICARRTFLFPPSRARILSSEGSPRFASSTPPRPRWWCSRST